MNPCNPCNPCLKNKKHQLKTKLINYEQQRKQQQNHVEQDSPRSNHHSNRYRNHLRGDIVHGALASGELKNNGGRIHTCRCYFKKGQHLNMSFTE